jgi:tRNA (guanine10-N2)-methyltransferase
MLDLIHMARWMLVPGGRLVFFLPTASEEYDEVDIPVVTGMREIKWESGSVQDFGKWGRRVCDMTFAWRISCATATRSAL